MNWGSLPPITRPVLTTLMVVGTWVMSRYDRYNCLMIHHTCCNSGVVHGGTSLGPMMGASYCGLCREPVPEQLQTLYTLYSMEQ